MRSVLSSFQRRSICISSQLRSISVVQGASRGLGLEFVKQLLENNSENYVVATCRHPDKSEHLSVLKKLYVERLTVLRLDVTDEDTIKEAANDIGNLHGNIELLVNTAGILHDQNLGIFPETSLSKVDAKALLLSYQINAVGPTLVIKHMAPLIKPGLSRKVAVVANVSARVSSIGDNRLGGWYSYRASKTALNQLTKTMSIEFARRKEAVACIVLHPGTVDTDLSKPYQRNVPKEKLFTREYSVQKLMEIINRIDVQSNGKFFGWDGQEIIW